MDAIKIFNLFCNTNNGEDKDNHEEQDTCNTEKKQVSVIENINEHFNVPIYFNQDRVELKENIATDLELTKTVDPSCNPIYHFYLDTSGNLSKKITEQISKYYTTDVSFLKDNQKLIKEYSPLLKVRPNCETMVEIWNEIKLDVNFKDSYYYVEWDFLDFLNTSEPFLQFISIYNMCSPVFSLMMPLVILILPFVVIRLKGHELTMNEYIEVLKFVAKTNAIGRFFTTDFTGMNIQEIIYMAVSAFFYVFSIYQNIMVCIKFNNNMIKIHKYFRDIREYIEDTVETMKNYLTFTEKLETHTDFNRILKSKMETLQHIHTKLSKISEYKITNLGKIYEFGSIFRCFYEFHKNQSYDDAILYSLGFNGYIQCIEGLQRNIFDKKINFAEFYEKERKNKKGQKGQKGQKDKKKNKVFFKNCYYASLSNNSIKPIKNTINLKKNMIITGPNASGKTTILKSTIINIIFTQQFGCGFYDDAVFTPFHHIHCYLNIPDTSGRDSLFQAEARRCKEILDCIDSHSKDKHFCLFDELYSGTNPEEAETSAASFMLYLQKYKLVTSMLTTHFVKVCKKLDNIGTIQNFKMVTEKDDNNHIIYKYKIAPGISEVKGGINVLTNLNYPKEIIDGSMNG